MVDGLSTVRIANATDAGPMGSLKEDVPAVEAD